MTDQEKITELESRVERLERIIMSTRNTVRTDKHNTKLETLLRIVCARTGADLTGVRTKLKSRLLADSRHIYCALARHTTDASLTEIGKVINRSYCNVHHSITTCNVLPDLRDIYNSIYNELKQTTSNETEHQASASSR
jgi:chromosomal replication initiation ATPase DnaA